MQGPISCDSISKVLEADLVSNLKKISFAKLVLFPSLTDIRIDELNGMRYLCGFLAVKVIKFHGGRHCSKCNLTSLINTEGMNNTFMMLKQFDHLQNNEGLQIVVIIFLFALLVVKKYFAENLVKCILEKTLFCISLIRSCVE